MPKFKTIIVMIIAMAAAWWVTDRLIRYSAADPTGFVDFTPSSKPGLDDAVAVAAFTVFALIGVFVAKKV